MLLAIDERDYSSVRRCLGETVEFDTSSLGGVARPLSREEMIAGLQMTFRFLKGTQHLLGALLVDEDQAGAINAVGQYQAYHFRDDLADRRLWVHGGRHRYRLGRIDDSFEVTALQVLMAWEWGDRATITAQPAS